MCGQYDKVVWLKTCHMHVHIHTCKVALHRYICTHTRSGKGLVACGCFVAHQPPVGAERKEAELNQHRPVKVAAASLQQPPPCPVLVACLERTWNAEVCLG